MPFPDAAREPRRDAAQQRVARIVAGRVVDLLEAVEVDEQDRDARGFGRADADVHAVVVEQRPAPHQGRCTFDLAACFVLFNSCADQ
ncbi:hypothetical protein WJ70_07690 [Burkholderia ubonensis]|nr:hypothetical protein WJ70_07690 [Burkholderia ubonensis]